MTVPDLALELSYSRLAKAGHHQQPQANNPPALDHHLQAVLDPSERPGLCQGVTLALRFLPVLEKVWNSYGINRDSHDSIIPESSKPSFGSLPKVRTKDDILKMLQTIRTEETKSPEMEIEDWN
jgi:hypothetical protein